jgi:hybrid cluster-associated redox disulfide protein
VIIKGFRDGGEGKMATIKKDMGIIEVVTKWPETAEVFMKHGMGCLGCAAARFENIEQGASAHGMNIQALIDDLNKVVEGKK